jgi:tetratricopeptide (TPR) repeat protein
MRAGANAARVYAMRAAIDHFRRAIDSLEKLPAAPPERLYDALLGWARVAFRFKRYADVLEEVERALDISRELGDKRRIAEALYWKGNTLLATGRISLGEPALIESLDLLEELGDESLQVVPRFVKAFGYMNPDPRTSDTQLEAATEMARKYGDKDTEAAALAITAMVAARLGDFKRSLEKSRAAEEVVNGLNSPMTAADVDLFTGWSYLDMGDPAQALEYAKRAVEKATATDRVECICFGFACVGFGHLQQQDLPKATEAFQESIKRSTASGAAHIEHVARTGLGLTQFMAGHPEAVQDLESTLEKARSLGDPYTIAFLSQVLGQAYTQLGDLDRAETHLNAALDYYRANHMRPYIARALQALAEVYEQQGRAPEADHARSEAAELAQELQISI